MNTAMIAPAGRSAGAGVGRLARMPVPIFGVPMGLLGVGLVWSLMHDRMGAPAWIAQGWLLLGLIAATGAAVMHVGKALRHPEAVWRDWHDAAVVPFYAQVPVTLLLLAEAAETWLPGAAAPLLLIGIALAVLLVVELARRWLEGLVPPGAVHAGWAIPGIALLVAASLVPRHGQTDAAAALIGLAALWFAVILPAMGSRLASAIAAPTPTRVLPAILIAVPAVALLAMEAVSPEPGPGHRLMVVALMAMALFLGVVALVRLPTLLRDVPFGPWWWAYGMPSAALGLALIVGAEHLDESVGNVLSTLGSALATTAMVTLMAATVRARPWRATDAATG